MNRGRQVQSYGQLSQQRHQLLALIWCESHRQCSLVKSRYVRQLTHNPLSLQRQMESTHPTIGWIAAPLEQAALLEIVDERDDVTRGYAQRPYQYLLWLALSGGHVQEHCCLAHVEAQAREALRPKRVRMPPERR